MNNIVLLSKLETIKIQLVAIDQDEGLDPDIKLKLGKVKKELDKIEDTIEKIRKKANKEVRIKNAKG